jgi:hypothetical protein
MVGVSQFVLRKRGQTLHKGAIAVASVNFMVKYFDFIACNYIGKAEFGKNNGRTRRWFKVGVH